MNTNGRYAGVLRKLRAAPVLVWAGLLMGSVVITSCSQDEVREDGLTNADVGVRTDISPQAVIDLVTPTRPFSVNVGGVLFNSGSDGSVGTGNLNPFLRIQNNGPQAGFNTDNANPYAETKTGLWTESLALNHIPVIGIGGTGYREFTFDANEAQDEFTMTALNVYICNTVASKNYNTLEQITAALGANTCRTVYTLGGNTLSMTSAFSSGSGNSSDYRLLIPETLFQAQISLFALGDDCDYAGPEAPECGAFVIFHSSMTGTESGFEEFSTVERPYIVVSKTVDVALTRTYNWQISKSVDPATITQFDGQSSNATWTVNVTPGSPAFTDGSTSVSGVITIENPSEFPVSVKTVTDAVDGGTFGTAVISSCTGGAIPTPGSPRPLSSGGSFTCAYSMTVIPNTTPGPHTNIATVSIAASVAGEDDALFEGEAEFDFADASVTSVNQNPNVYDNNNGAGEQLLGTASSSPFTYQVSYACGSSRTVSNVARIDLAPTGNATGDPTDDATLTINCLDLDIEKTAATSVNRTFLWLISKSATPTSWNLFNGDQGTSRYTVTATPNGFSDAGLTVTGDITITNPNTVPVYLQALPTDVLTGALSATVTCPKVGAPTVFPYTLPAAGTLVCSYTRGLPDATTRDNIASVTAKPTPAGTNKAFADTLSVNPANATPTETNRTVNITDTFDGGTPSALGTATWGVGTTPGSPTVFNPEHTFSCPADAKTWNNVATITQTGQTANASVVVTCHTLTTTKTATPLFKRTWNWSVAKSIDPNDLDVELMKNEVYQPDYTVTYTSSAPVDSAMRVEGTIRVRNIAPIPAVINSVTDVISGGGGSPVPSCGVTFPYTLAAGSPGTPTDLNCTYSQSLPDKTGRTNTATATRQAKSYTYALVASNNGTVDYSGQAAITFPATPTTAIDECVTVDDSQPSGAVVTGTICAGDPAINKTFTYQHTFATDVCGPYTLTNIAVLTTTTGTSGSIANTTTSAADADTLAVDVNVNCLEGCTLTQGYWKTHNESFKGGASKKADPGWLNIGATKELTGFFTSTDPTYDVIGPNAAPFSWFTVFWTPPKGNAYYNLAHQYQAARLNALNGADPSAVSAELAAAKDFFDSYTPTNYPNGMKKDMLKWAGKLGSYNEGAIGPGHCDEDNTSDLGNIS